MNTATQLVNSIAAEPPRLGEKSAVLSRRSLFGGIILLIVGLIIGYSGHEMSHFFHAWLVGASFVLSIALGGLFFTLIHHLTAAGWSTMMRRQAEFMASLLPFAAVLFAPVVLPTLFGYSGLYPWADAEWAAADPIVAKKMGYLNGVFFCIRMALYFVIWFEMQRWFVKNSIAQDSDGDARKSVKMRMMAAPATLVFALSITFFAFDALMSLDPHWFSTIFGVYFFAGSAIAVYATMILSSLALEKGPLKGMITLEHYHDLGKWLFAMVFFWGYIAFSQYILIWYADIPEETVWYKHRSEDGWQYVSLILLFGHLLIPFGGLISRKVKRNRQLIAFWAIYMLTVHLVDLFWLVNPTVGGHGEHGGESHGLPFGLIDVVTWAGLILVSLGVALAKACKHPVVPAKDPRLDESLAFENH